MPLICRQKDSCSFLGWSSLFARFVNLFLKDICWLHQYSSTLQLELCVIFDTAECKPPRNIGHLMNKTATELNFIAHDFLNRSEQLNNIPKHNASDRQRTACSLHVHAQFMRPQVVQQSRKNKSRTQPNILLSLYQTTQANRMLPDHLVKT
jgi:hypothetical protein